MSISPATRFFHFESFSYVANHADGGLLGRFDNAERQNASGGPVECDGVDCGIHVGHLFRRVPHTGGGVVLIAPRFRCVDRFAIDPEPVAELPKALIKHGRNRFVGSRSDVDEDVSAAADRLGYLDDEFVHR